MTADLILASGSAARQNMLRQAGFDFDIMPAEIDEEHIIAEQAGTLNGKELALLLANEKAKFISLQQQDKYIIGSDQILSLIHI